MFEWTQQKRNGTSNARKHHPVVSGKMIVSNPMALAIAEWLTIERRGIEHHLTGNVYGTRKSGRPAPSLAGQAHAGRGGRSVQEFD